MKPLQWIGWIALTTSFAGCNAPAQARVPGAQLACACPGGTDGALPLSRVGPGDATVCDAVPLDCLAGSDQGFAGDWETVDFTAAAA